MKLKAGLMISVQGRRSEEFAARVVGACQEGVTAELVKPQVPLPLHPGDDIRVKYWDEGTSVFFWDAEIVNVELPGVLRIPTRGEGVTVQQRRSYRVRLNVPFSVTVIQAARTDLIGQKLPHCATEDISVGGLAFETQFGLEPGDKLEMSIHLSPATTVQAVGWVVRCQGPDDENNTASTEERSKGCRVGVKFLHLEEQEQITLERFLSLTVDAPKLEKLRGALRRRLSQRGTQELQT